MRVDKGWMKFAQSINSMRILKSKLKCYMDTESSLGMLRVAISNMHLNQFRNSFAIDFQNAASVLGGLRVKNKLKLDLGAPASFGFKFSARNLHKAWEQPIWDDLFDDSFQSEARVNLNFMSWQFDKYEREYLVKDVLKVSNANLRLSLDGQLFEFI